MISESEQFAVNRALENILADDKFSGSPQMSAFLRYVVSETLQGNADRIKAYTVAVDALGKSDAFDPQNDPSVRVLAKRLRSCLDDYNQRVVNPEVIIEVKAGSYKPIFSKPNDASGNNASVAQSSSELPESLQPQALGILLDDGVMNQGSSDPLVAVPKRNESVAGMAQTLDGPTTPIFASTEALNESSIHENNKQPSQQAAKPVSIALAKAQKQAHAQTLVSDSSTLASRLFHTAQVHKYLSVALVLVTAALLVVSSGDSGPASEATETVSQSIPDGYALQLASASNVIAARQRPAIPTVIVRANSREDKLTQSLLSSISHVLSKFDHVQLLKPTHEYDQSDKWPEDYEIVVDTLVLHDSKKINVNLINAASGRVTYSDALFLGASAAAGNPATSFTKDNVVAIESFVARVVQKNGPLALDYKNQHKYSTTMACVFSITDSHSGEECLDNVVAQGKSEAIGQALRTELSLVKAANISGTQRKDALKQALSAAQKNLQLTPYSADAHALMMRVSRLNGNYNTALKHGNYAMNINQLDSDNMLAFATLLDEMKKPDEADEMRKQASFLSTTLHGLSL